jgi:DNA-binding transcriptional MerR regulator
VTTSSPPRRLTIGAVLEDLRGEFPEITISKIRFLETEGLVEPARTASGYRSFAAADVERLRYVLRAQRDRFWPLRVIRESLDALDRGLVPEADEPDARPRAPHATPDPDLATVADLANPAAVRLTATELCQASGLSTAECDALRAHGLLRPDEEGYLGEADLRVAEAAAGLAAYGIEARHLRAFRTAADREVGLVDQAVGATHPGADRRAAAAEVARLCLALHTALVKGGLHAGPGAH